VPID